jgi:hypothetical protein
MDTKKAAARAAKEVRTSTTRNVERSQILTKRPSAPPPELAAKKRSASLPPPVPDNDNAAKKSQAPVAMKSQSQAPVAMKSQAPMAMKSQPPGPMKSQAPMAMKSQAPVPIGRGRLPTGSLHTEARVPAGAENIKQRLTALVNTQQKLSELKRSSQKNFYPIGEMLHRVREQRLFEVKGYGSFEAFIEREVNLGQQFCLQCVRIYETFLPEAVTTHGFARLVAALDALDAASVASLPTGDGAKMGRSPIPPHKL